MNKISLGYCLQTLFPYGWILSVNTEEVGVALTLILPWDMDTAFPLDTALLWNGEWPCWAPESHWWSGRPIFPRLETTSGQCGNEEVPLQNQIFLGPIKNLSRTAQFIQLAPSYFPCANLKCCNFSNFTSSWVERLDNKEYWRTKL